MENNFICIIYKIMFPIVALTNNYKIMFPFVALTNNYKRKSLIYKARLNNKSVQSYPMLSGKENNTFLIFYIEILFSEKKHIPTKARPIQMNADLE